MDSIGEELDYWKDSVIESVYPDHRVKQILCDGGTDAREDLYNDIFDRLYYEAVPGLDEIRSHDYNESEPLNQLHYLDGDRLIEIIDEECREYDLSRSERKKVRMSVVLSKAPSTSLRNVDERREREGLEPVSELLDRGVTQ